MKKDNMKINYFLLVALSILLITINLPDTKTNTVEAIEQNNLPIQSYYSSNEYVKITWAEDLPSAQTKYASIILSKEGLSPVIEINMKDHIITKISDTVYHVAITVPDNSHGVIAIYVGGDNIEALKTTKTY